MKKIHSKKAFTLVELLIAILIIAASWSIAATLTPKGQTAKREAERLAMLLEKTMAQAIRTHVGFALIFDSNHSEKITIRQGKASNALEAESEFIVASEGCSFDRKNSNNELQKTLYYSAVHGTMSPGVTIQINNAPEPPHYVIISGQGRVRMSATPPKKWEDD